MRSVHIEQAVGPTTEDGPLEIVERKGIGHPDTVCDGIMDRVSQGLCRAYLDRFGKILHHNCDKALLAAGQVEHRFGGGRVIEPMRLVMGDRAQYSLGDREVDVPGIVVGAAKSWLREHLRHVDPDRHLRYQIELRPGSTELAATLPIVPTSGAAANDTSAAVGHAPPTETERLVLEAERYLNGPVARARFPQIGEDVKVMGVRTGDELDLTVAVPLLDRYVRDADDYFDIRAALADELARHLDAQRRRVQRLSVTLNALDDRSRGMAGMYLSVLGTSAEDADSGQVGRGNDASGLISLCRPRGAEAAAGKNPVSHVGKIYSVLAFRLAHALRNHVPGVREATVFLCSRIGDPVAEPQTTWVRVNFDRDTDIARAERTIRKLVDCERAQLPTLCWALATGRGDEMPLAATAHAKMPC